MTAQAGGAGSGGRELSPGDGGRGAAPGADAARHFHAYLRGVGGVRLFYRSWERPEAEVIVLLVHGLGEHSGRWARVAEALSAEGMAVYALDLRGHGRSLGRRGHAVSFEHLLRDVDRLRRTAVPGGWAGSGDGGDPGDGADFGAPDRRVVLMGHSLGGLVVLRYLQAFPSPTVAGAVAVAPFVRLRAEVPAWKLTLGRLADRWLPGLTLDSEIEREMLLRQPEARERHRRDPLVHRRISARLWGEMQREARRLQGNSRTGRPVLLQVVGDDLVVDSEAIRALAPRLSPAAEVREYPAAYHDLYHDPEGPAALRDATRWMRTLDPPDG